MNNEIYNRICSLYSQLGIDTASGSSGRGEAAALAAGFDIINSALDDILKNIFVQTADKKGLGMYLSLINEKQEDNCESSRNIIFNRFSKGSGYMKYDDFISALKQTGSKGNVYITGNSINIPDLAYPIDKDSLIKAGSFIKNYKPVFCHITFNGGGIDFNGIDRLDMPWYQLDDVNLPFYLLEQLA